MASNNKKMDVKKMEAKIKKDLKSDKLIKKGLNEPKYNGIAEKNSQDWHKRVLIFTPSRGLVRHEWVQARYGQIIPTNWSMVELTQFLSPYIPIEYQLADAQNLMAKLVVEGDYEWVIYIEDDNVIPADTILKFNEYMNDGKIPSVSGLYFTKSVPPEPIVYRGQGNSYFKEWKLGEKFFVDGIPFGCRLEHAGMLKAAWETSPEYVVNGVTTRRVFYQPNRVTFDGQNQGFAAVGGTTDLAWCKRIMDEDLFTKAGFPEFDKMEYPFLVDSTIFVKHIDQDGRQFPLEVPKRFLPDGE